MMKQVLYAVLATGTVLVSQMPANAESILEDPTIRQLQDQDVDANKALLDALIAAGRKPAEFKISPERVVIDMMAGARGSATVRITNVGGEDGEISGVNLLGSIPGMDLSTTCEDVLAKGKYCEATIVFRSDTPRDINTVLVGSINERDRSSFEVPVEISVRPKPEPKPDPEPAEPVVVRPDPALKGPVPQDVARGYFRVLGPIGRNMNSSRGFTIVSAKKDPSSSMEVAGVNYDDIAVKTVKTDARYDESIPSTEASLPVNRDRILTTDRVIKAVLETPVSNVMCNKVVALVESDVYSATSSRPLIQAGSRVIGECKDFVDERVGIAWSRIITTDGRSISFQDRVADTNDATGIGGVPGRVYMSPFDKYVLPIFSTMIDTAAGVVFAKFGDNQKVYTDEFGNTISETSAKNEGLRIVTEEARGTAQDIIKDIRDVREVAVIPKGSRIDIEIQQDIYFRKDRKVVALSDMQFALDDVKVGGAERDIPKNLTLVPVGASYSGATLQVNGRRYRVDQAAASSGETVSAVIPDISKKTMDDLSSKTSSNE